VHVRAQVTAAVRPGVVELPKGLWARHTENGATANALAPDSLTDVGGGACFNDARVEIARLGE
jgi:anaerobic selenocysteine-containing dehydrogenase